MVQAMSMEMEQRAQEWKDAPLRSIYFGGGTPSLLNAQELAHLFETIHRLFVLEDKVEITLEANPEDLSSEKIQSLQSMGVNRISLGVQSFQEDNLTYLNRGHSLIQTQQAITALQEQGINNWSLDLIYGIPGNGLNALEKDLTMAINSQASHISAYCLTIEPQTVFGRWQSQGRFQAMEDEGLLAAFDLVQAFLPAHGYEAYEISNFAKNQAYAIHNTSYWFHRPYLGIGPSAHSFDGQARRWNVSNNAHYLQGVEQGKPYFDGEPLDAKDLINEKIMTRLRTQWGLKLSDLDVDFKALGQALPYKELRQWEAQGLLSLTDDHVRLLPAGKGRADAISAALFIV